MRELLKEYYALIYNGGSQTPLDLFYSGAPYETKNFQSNCKVTLPPGVNGQLSNLWRTVPEFSQCESLQCVYWFSCIWAVPSIPIETRLLLSVLGVRILVRDDWFLSGGCFEEEFFSKAKELHTIHIGYQNDRVYMQVGRFMLGALIADGIRQAGELSAAQGLPAERNEGTPSHLSSDEQRMLELLKENPRMTHKELGSRLGKSERGSQRCAQRLQSLGVLVRNGSTRAGGWVVVHRDSSGKGSM
ncbi:Winged helix-turn-helix DNA-binding [Marinobacterium lutimaris]|uniref:Winged helix-turn-helix DNA-binding n=2 Tax=Marinobacterium lutimaris TaxID=568106 RepID=A0A1H5VPW7_9GAMM|nr:Winged helix-turn-helix DNA-binding [Marinobacterium lutimaris]